MITIVGSGRVGATTAAFLMFYELDNEVTLIDVIKGLPQGEALDLNHAAAILGKSVRYKGSNDYKDMEGSDIVIVTAGLARKPGMTREELAGKNAEIISSIADQIKKYAPNSIVIITTNPLDAMVYVLYKRLGFPRNRVIGFSGVLDSNRMAYYASQIIGIAPESIIPVVLGQHGENMYPVPEASFVYGKPLTEFLTQEQYNDIVKKTIQAGADITNLRGFSSNWGPAAGLALMVDSIKKNRRRVFEASVYLDGEYGVKDVFAEVPVVLGKNGVEKIIELNLTPEQRQKFMQSIEAVKKNLTQVPPQYLK
ncbi:malate dehydrogenase [Caldivirga maquilingensis]|uniref:Malate dehydrogenase n=1 Tax=Caldivirga maquilingensis (strain ATCC 700844 / DSM 13496 / JCM 10307 / IC-167) TaxID=397948 RepID=MDH_CALMQ|nr:malate dehydrogenase [Caldivirga maquilingensis]A8MAC1.1 RecName: Full=Malate dehydrogenase [Caldivirga maquilingensis IC-167]ABW02498.1 Lactate/malate dehydrogenase [Caldivirga maquilingensis IC-167]